MQLLTANIFVFVVFVIDNSQSELSPVGQNVCLKSETYEEKVQVKVKKPTTVETTEWCWSIKKMFKCKKTNTIWEDVIELRPFTRTRIVPKCCDGYEEEIEYEMYRPRKKCSPVCLKGCKYGKCVAPEICDCFSGYYGLECNKACSEGYWGKNCSKTCDCSNKGKCDKFNGVCYCETGWIGDRCESSCQSGYYGYMCKMKCECGDSSCDHQTGECFTTTAPTTQPLPEVYPTTESIATETDFEVHQTSESIKMTERDSSSTERTTEETTAYMLYEDISVSVIPKSETVFSQATEFTGNKKLGSDIFTSLTESIGESSLETSTESSNEEIQVTEKINEPIHIPINKTTGINLSGSKQDLDNVETDNFITDNEGNKKTMVKIFHFLPGLSVFSSVSILTFIIAALWLINKHRNKTRLTLATHEKKNKPFQHEEQIKYPAENFFWSSNIVNNPAYLSDVDINRTIPVLETFKSVKSDKNGVQTEKETR